MRDKNRIYRGDLAVDRRRTLMNHLRHLNASDSHRSKRASLATPQHATSQLSCNFFTAPHYTNGNDGNCFCCRRGRQGPQPIAPCRRPHPLSSVMRALPFYYWLTSTCPSISFGMERCISVSSVGARSASLPLRMVLYSSSMRMHGTGFVVCAVFGVPSAFSM